MSSFTIGKQEYVKVAGYIAGIAEGTSIGCREFWVYDTIEHKNTDTDLYYKRFVQCYEMNAKSVQEQYKDNKPETDSNDYMKEFREYFKQGKVLMMEDTQTQRQAITEIQHFFHSALYQTENDKYNFIMRHWFNMILDQLVERVLLAGCEAESWGTFEIKKSNRNIVRIA